MWNLRTALVIVFIGIAMCEAMAGGDADWRLPRLILAQPRQDMQICPSTHHQQLHLHPIPGVHRLLQKPSPLALRHASILEELEDKKEKKSNGNLPALVAMSAQDLKKELKDVFKKFDELNEDDLKREASYFRSFIGLPAVSEENQARIAHNILLKKSC